MDVNQVSYFKASISSPQATLTKSTISSVNVVNVNNTDAVITYASTNALIGNVGATGFWYYYDYGYYDLGYGYGYDYGYYWY